MNIPLIEKGKIDMPLEYCCDVNEFQKYLTSVDTKWPPNSPKIQTLQTTSKDTQPTNKTKIKFGSLEFNDNRQIHNSPLKDKYSVARLKLKSNKEPHRTTVALAFQTFLSYLLLIVTGYLKSLVRSVKIIEKNRTGYAPLYSGFEGFYTRTIYWPIRNIFNVPICSVPGEYVNIMERVSHDYGLSFQMTGNIRKCINMGSYNYLGFAQNHGTCAESAILKLKSCGTSVCSTRQELGNASYLEELEKLVARFVGTEDAITCAMGYATNSLNLPVIMTEGCLVLSDENNHCSIILGLRLSRAKTRVFKHNDMKDLERLLRDGILCGQPESGLPWEKIFIVVEGIYSMEGSIVPLSKILELKRKYRAYLYLDEAHSIGALGKRGRGVVDYWDEDPRDVDILMGTFTKSFGSAGGYIAGSRQLIQMLREGSRAHCYGTVMSPPIAQQIICSMKIIMGEDVTDDGIKKIQQLARNSKYFRQKLRQRRFIVYGDEDSPVVPVAIFLPHKVVNVTREMVKRGVATVGVGYPATPLTGGRIRFCVSSSHTTEMLDQVVEHMCLVGNTVKVCQSSLP